MLAATRARAGDTPRLRTRRIEIADRDWRRFDPPLRAAVSSLAVHHLDGPGKRVLFSDLHDAIAPGGVFVLADFIQPVTRAGTRIAAELWDEAVRRRAAKRGGSLDGFRAFERAAWNHFHQPAPDPVDMPSPLVDQIDLLREAGFGDIDLHWMTAGQMLLSAWRR